MTTAHNIDRQRHPNRILWAGSVLAFCVWLIESLVHKLLLDPHQSIREALLPTDPNELYMRTVIVVMIIAFSIYARYVNLKLLQAHENTSAILESTTDGYLVLSKGWVIRYINEQAEQMFDVEMDEVLGEELWTVFPEAASTFYKPLDEVMRDRKAKRFGAFYTATAMWYEVHAYPVGNGLACHLHDITEEKELRDTTEKLNRILGSTADGIISINQKGIVTLFNKASERMFGYTAKEVVGRNVAMLMSPEDAEKHDEYLQNYVRSNRSLFVNAGPREVTAVRKNGEKFPMDLAVSEMYSGGERLFIGIVRDITQRHTLEETLRYTSNYDFLTGLVNRKFFTERLSHAIEQARRYKGMLALLFIDLDQFKQVNDTLGHDAGDALLTETADRLTKNVRESDTTARLGGDEFTVIMEKIKAPEDAALVAEKLIEKLSAAVMYRDAEIKVTPSIGIAIYPDHAQDAEALLRAADKAMYAAKKKRGVYCVFDG